MTSFFAFLKYKIRAHSSHVSVRWLYFEPVIKAFQDTLFTIQSIVETTNLPFPHILPPPAPTKLQHSVIASTMQLSKCYTHCSDTIELTSRLDFLLPRYFNAANLLKNPHSCYETKGLDNCPEFSQTNL